MKIGKMLWGLHGLDYDFCQQLGWIKKQGFEEVSFHSTSWKDPEQRMHPRSKGVHLQIYLDS